MMTGVVVSKQVEGITVDRGRNVGECRKREMTDRTVRGNEIGKKWRRASSDEYSRRLRESTGGSDTTGGGNTGVRAAGGEPEESVEGEVADAGTCTGMGNGGRMGGWGYNKTKHDECPDVQAASRKNATKMDG